jgi:hypothetical protein
MPGAGLAGMQETVRAREAVSGAIRNFNPWGVPGLLQTPEYGRGMLGLADLEKTSDVDAAAEVRVHRQGILGDPTRRLEFVLTERALRLRPGPLPVLGAQLEHLVGLAALPTVSIRVIPASALAHALEYCNVAIYDDRRDGTPPFVSVELPHKELPVDDPGEVEAFRKWFEVLWRSAISGDEAVAFVREVARSLGY